VSEYKRLLQNSAIIHARQSAADFKDHRRFSNTVTGTIDLSGGTLQLVKVDIAQSGKVTVRTKRNAKVTLARPPLRRLGTVPIKAKST